MEDMEVAYSIRFENVRISKRVFCYTSGVTMTPVLLVNDRVLQVLEDITVVAGDEITIKRIMVHNFSGVFVEEALRREGDRR